MIIGNGTIANSFTNLDHSSLCVFASGVSNSLETSVSQFDKEFNLLKNVLQQYPFLKLIYFSTTSIDTKTNKTPYTHHKIKIEKYIEKNAKDYLILRLPNVVSKPKNNTQLINYLYTSLINNIPIKIDPNYKRYLIDVEDIPKIIQLLITNYPHTKKLAVIFSNGLTMDNLTSLLENIVGVKYKNVIQIESIKEQIPTFEPFSQYIKTLPPNYFNINPLQIIKKYYIN